MLGTGRSSLVHPDSELRFVNPVIGHGLFATRLIPKGTITWVGDDLDQFITPEAAARLLASCLAAYWLLYTTVSTASSSRYICRC